MIVVLQCADFYYLDRADDPDALREWVQRYCPFVVTEVGSYDVVNEPLVFEIVKELNAKRVVRGQWYALDRTQLMELMHYLGKKEATTPAQVVPLERRSR